MNLYKLNKYITYPPSTKNKEIPDKKAININMSLVYAIILVLG